MGLRRGTRHVKSLESHVRVQQNNIMSRLIRRRTGGRILHATNSQYKGTEASRHSGI